LATKLHTPENIPKETMRHPWQFPLVLVGKTGWRYCRALGDEESKVMGSVLSMQQEEEK
jgi:hypothetical protein